MSAKEFWEDDPDLFWAYRFSMYNKSKREMEEMDYRAWLHGAYVYEAVSVALNNLLSDEQVSYRDKPFSAEEKEREEKPQESQVVIDVKGRIAQIQAMWKIKEESSTPEEIVKE